MTKEMLPAEQLNQQTLLMDADDTLWENNVYFEQAIASFISLLDHQVHSAAQVRDVLNECEHETIRLHGYGVSSFEKSLLRCFEKLSETPLSSVLSDQIKSVARSIVEHEIELLPGVAETLPSLGARHTIILVTKGNAVEQQHKLDCSGMHEHFRAVEIPAEKNVAAYQSLLARYALDPASTWMIGNSPKSDINPALMAGLNAVYIHHPSTWILEHAVLGEPLPARRLLRLGGFAELTHYF